MMRINGTTGEALLSVGDGNNWDTSNAYDHQTGVIMSQNTWTHFATVYDGSKFMFFEDGDHQDGKDLTYSSITATTDFEIGAQPGGPNDFVGYIDEFRISDNARYTDTGYSNQTSAFSVDSNTVLLIHGNGGKFTDSSSSPHTITATGAYHSQAHGGIASALTFPTSGKLNGSAGVYFNGAASSTTKTIEIDDEESDVLSECIEATDQDYSIDCWVNFIELPTADSDQVLICTQDASGNSFSYGRQKTGGTEYWGMCAPGPTLTHSNNTSSGKISLNTWHHILFDTVRQSGSPRITTHIYIDGLYWGYDTADTAHDASLRYIVFGAGRNHDTSGTYYNLPNAYVDGFRVSKGRVITDSTDPLYTGGTTSNSSINFNAGLPTKIYGAYKDKTIPTITFTGQLASGSLASDEDIEFSNVANTSNPSGMQKLNDSKIGLTLTNLTSTDKNKAELTGTISDNFSGTSRANLPVKAQVRTERGNASGTSGEATITFGSGTDTEGLQPGYYILTGSATNAVTEVTLTGASYNNGTTVTFGSSVTSDIAVGMVAFGKGIPNGTTVSTIDSGTQITLSASTTDGSLSSQSLTFTNVIKSIDSATQITVTKAHSGTVSGTIYFGDPERVQIANGNATSTASDAIVMGTSDPMLTIAIDSETKPKLFSGRRYMGNETARDINGLNFRPDLVWFKQRETSKSHQLIDSLRGGNKIIYPDLNSGTSTRTAGGGYITAFNSDGFSLDSDTSGNGINTNNQPFISYAWKAGGPSSGSGLSLSGGIGAGTLDNTGSATSITQSVNQNSGLSITTFNGHADGCTIPHNLGGNASVYCNMQLRY